VGAGWDPLGEAGASQDCGRGLLVERSMVWVEGVSEVAGAGRPFSPTSMASSLSGEASDTSSAQCGGALGCGWGNWSSSVFSGEGMGVVTAVRAVGRRGPTTAGDSFGVAALWGGGILAWVS